MVQKSGCYTGAQKSSAQFSTSPHFYVTLGKSLLPERFEVCRYPQMHRALCLSSLPVKLRNYICPTFERLGGNKYTDNHELPRTFTWVKPTTGAWNFCPDPVTQILRLCPEAQGFLYLSKLERIFFFLLTSLLMIQKVSDITPYHR